MDPPEGQRRFPDCGHLGNVYDQLTSCFICREKLGQCSVEDRCPVCIDWFAQWFEDVRPVHKLSIRSKSLSSKSSNDSSSSRSNLSRPKLPVITPVDSKIEPKRRSISGSRGTNTNILKKLLENVKPGKGTEKTVSKPNFNSTKLVSREKSLGRRTSPTSQSADGSMATPREKPTTHLPQDIAPAIPVMSGKKGSTTLVFDHVGHMKADMYPLTEHQRTQKAQGVRLGLRSRGLTTDVAPAYPNVTEYD